MVLTSPNMNLPVPSVGSEAGPTYAFDINSCLTLIDQHDHSPGKGIQINPTGLNINSALSFQSNNATNLGAAVFTALSTATPTLQALSVAPGSTENDLWYTDSNGVKVQITNGGTLNAVPTTVSGITYTAGTFVFNQTPDSLTNPAALDAGSVTIRPNVALTTFGVTLAPPSAISSQYSLVLPLLPASNSFMALDNLGNVTATIPISNGLTSSNIALQGITAASILNGTLTGTQMQSNINLPGTHAQVGGLAIITSASNANPALKIITGSVAANGTIISGTDFTVTKGGTGSYTLNWSFSGTPSVVTAPGALVAGQFTLIAVTAQNNALATILTANTGSGGRDSPFQFIAIGPR